MLQKNGSRLGALGLALGLLMVSSVSMATSAFDGITSAISFADVITAIGLAFAAVAAVVVVMKGGKWILKVL